MHVVHLAAQPTARRWATEYPEPADATVAAALGARDTLDATRSAEPAVGTVGVEAGEAEGHEEAHDEEGCQEEGTGQEEARGEEAPGEAEEGAGA